MDRSLFVSFLLLLVLGPQPGPQHGFLKFRSFLFFPGVPCPSAKELHRSIAFSKAQKHRPAPAKGCLMEFFR